MPVRFATGVHYFKMIESIVPLLVFNSEAHLIERFDVFLLEK